MNELNKALIKLGARLTNNNYHLSIDKDMNGPNKAIFNTISNQIGEKIRFGVITFTVSSTVFFSRTPL